MEIVKELSDIAEKWTEPEYRARPELSQSTLGTYEKTGFNGLDHLFDRKESDSLTYGSCVDAWLTGGEDEFNSLYYVANIDLSDNGYTIVKQLAEMHLPYESFNEIPEQTVSDVAKSTGFWKDDKWDKRRYSEVLKTGTVEEYYYVLRTVPDKTVISNETYLSMLDSVRALKESPATCGCFADNDPMSPVRRYYQLKFKMYHNGVGYRGMMDLVAVDYEKKIVYPFDLKTSSHFEWDFEQSFIQWGYCFQAKLYWRLLRYNMDKDDYFKDFKLMDYKFIVVNRKTLTPLIWEFPYTQHVGSLYTEDGKEIRDPYVVGEELQAYLNCRPQVPNGINQFGINTIKCLKPKEDEQSKVSEL